MASLARTRLGRVAVLALAGTPVLGLAACSGDDDQTPKGPRPAAVALSDLKVKDPMTLGLLVTVDSAPGQGDALLASAAGAQVAVERLRLGGSKITLDVQDDRGTAEGASAAVKEMVGQGVSGIVVASTGDHLDDALDAASKAGVPVIAPYLREAAALPAGVWLTGPDDAGVAAATKQALADQSLTKPFVVSADGVASPVDALEGVDAGDSAGSASRVVAAVQKAVKAKRADSVVVAAAPDTQGKIVAALQGRVPDLPVVLTPDALSPTFAKTLDEAGGTVADELTTVGIDATDATTLGQGRPAESAAAYFAALRLLADNPDAKDLFGSGPFSDAASGADLASHDAVIAFATAAAEADSVTASDVAATLKGLQVEAADGLAGPQLDFGATEALAQKDVVPLVSTSQDPGVRPALSTTAALHWFAIPAQEG